MLRILRVNLVLNSTLTSACSMNTSARAPYEILHNTNEDDCTYENVQDDDAKNMKAWFVKRRK
jgi:hypothetical protein